MISAKKIGILLLIMLFVSLWGTKGLANEAKQKIYLLPLSYTGSSESLDLLVREIPRVYKNVDVVLLNKKIIDCPGSRNETPRQKTYNGPLLLVNCLKKYDNQDINSRLLAITSEEITTKKTIEGKLYLFKSINGLGQLNHKYGIITDYRTRNVYKMGVDHSKQFFLGVALHELGHMFGLGHCDDELSWKRINCLMVGRDIHYRILSLRKKMLCPSCIEKLRSRGLIV